MERRYRFNTFFEEVVFGWKCKEYTEAEIYMNGDDVWKVFNSCMEKSHKHEEHIPDLLKLDSNYFTVPKDILYLDDEFYGYLMKYAGISLDKYIVSKTPNMDKKIQILRKLLDAINCLKEKKIVHGDVRFSNVLVEEVEDTDEIVRLTDLNFMIFPDTNMYHLNRLHSEWALFLKSIDYIDDLAFNLITFILINFDDDELVNLLSDDLNFDINYLIWIFSKDRGYFDKEVFDVVSSAATCDRGATKELKPNTFLLDYLK